MARKKVRYRVKIDDVAREIFSVGEGSTGDLSVIFRGTDNTSKGDKDRTLGRVLESRLSVHRSLESVLDGTTVTRTVKFQDGDSVKLSAFIKHSKKNLLWRLSSIALPDLSSPRYDPSKSPTSQVIGLRTDLTIDATLVCHIFVADKLRSPVSVRPALVDSWDFEYFRIIVYTNYMNLPPIHIWADITMPTTSSVVNGSKISDAERFFENNYPSGAISLTDQDIAQLIHSLNEKLYRGVVFGIRQFLIDRNADEAADLIITQKPLFSVYPARNGVLDVQNGPREHWSPPKQS